MDKNEAQKMVLADMVGTYLDLFDSLWQEFVEFSPEQLGDYIRAAEYLKAMGKHRDWKTLEEVKDSLDNDISIDL
jgi:hypothetical protein